jgi:tRNA uridine 5-carbamoylmethylation protein Kti12
VINFSHFEVVEAILHAALFHILKTILYIAICMGVNYAMTMRNDLMNVRKKRSERLRGCLYPRFISLSEN